MTRGACEPSGHRRRDSSNRGPFDENAKRILTELDRQRGFVGYSLRSRILGHEVWTMTVWCTAADLEAFVASRAHQRGIRGGMPSVSKARFARVIVRRRDLPLSWETALEVLRDRGDSHGY